MGITFAFRSDTITARYAGGERTPGLNSDTANNQPTISSDVTAIGGKSLDLYRSTTGGVHIVHWPARDNIGATCTMSVLCRVAFFDLSTTGQAVFFIGGPWARQNNGLGMVYLSGQNIRYHLRCEIHTHHPRFHPQSHSDGSECPALLYVRDGQYGFCRWENDLSVWLPGVRAGRRHPHWSTQWYCESSYSSLFTDESIAQLHN